MKIPPKLPKYGNFEIVYCTLISEWCSVKNTHIWTLDLVYSINRIHLNTNMPSNDCSFDLYIQVLNTDFTL